MLKNDRRPMGSAVTRVIIVESILKAGAPAEGRVGGKSTGTSDLLS